MTNILYRIENNEYEIVKDYLSGMSKIDVCKKYNIINKTLNRILYDFITAPSMDELRAAVKSKVML